MKNSLLKLWKLLNPKDRFRLAGLLGIFLICAGLDIVGLGVIPIFIAFLSDPEKVKDNPWFDMFFDSSFLDEPYTVLSVGSLFIIFIFLIKIIFNWFSVMLQGRYLADIQSRLGVDLFDAYMRSDYSFYINQNSAILIRNCNAEVRMVVTGSLAPVLDGIAQAMIGLALLIFLLVYSPVVTLLGISLLTLSGIVFLKIIHKKTTFHAYSSQHHRAESLKILKQGFSGFKEVKILRCQQYFISKYKTSISAIIRAELYQNVITKMVSPSIELVSIIGVISVAALLLFVQENFDNIVPTLALFAVAILRLQRTTRTLISTINTIRYRKASIDTVYDHYQELKKHHVKFMNDNSFFIKKPFRNAIELHNVSFKYKNSSKTVLSNINLKIPYGSSVAFIGSTGAGKSTLADLLLGLLLPDDGSILVDGKDIHENLAAWQANIGYIPQELYLIDDTLRSNIALGVDKQDISDYRIMEAVRIAQLEELLEELPDGIETVVGDRGIRLSGGQRQRICIARALYRDPSVLILDEATSALDNHTEQRIVEELEAHRGNRTLIVIAHRLSTVRRCDQLYLLSKGHIIASDTYTGLLSNNQMFQELVGSHEGLSHSSVDP